MKTCKVCNIKYQPRNTLQKVCSVPCARKYGKEKEMEKASKAARRNLRDRKNALKTLGEHKKELQVIFNKFIRLRDHKEQCISCQRHHEGQYHAGHFLTVGARPELRFNEDNCHKQSAPSNNHLSGNLINYRINLINKIGLERVEALQADHQPKHYTITEIEALKKHYRRKVKELEKELAE